ARSGRRSVSGGRSGLPTSERRATRKEAGPLNAAPPVVLSWSPESCWLFGRYPARRRWRLRAAVRRDRRAGRRFGRQLRTELDDLAPFHAAHLDAGVAAVAGRRVAERHKPGTAPLRAVFVDCLGEVSAREVLARGLQR